MGGAGFRLRSVAFQWLLPKIARVAQLQLVVTDSATCGLGGCGGRHFSFFMSPGHPMRANRPWDEALHTCFVHSAPRRPPAGVRPLHRDPAAGQRPDAVQERRRLFPGQGGGHEAGRRPARSGDSESPARAEAVSRREGGAFSPWTPQARARSQDASNSICMAHMRACLWVVAGARWRGAALAETGSGSAISSDGLVSGSRACARLSVHA